MKGFGWSVWSTWSSDVQMATMGASRLLRFRVVAAVLLAAGLLTVWKVQNGLYVPFVQYGQTVLATACSLQNITLMAASDVSRSQGGVEEVNPGGNYSVEIDLEIGDGGPSPSVEQEKGCQKEELSASKVQGKGGQEELEGVARPQEDGGKGGQKECNLFQGRWVDPGIDPSVDPELIGPYPVYNRTSCPSGILNPHWDCVGNGRLDQDYLKLRWKPDDCYLPRLDDPAVLEGLRGKVIGCIGDSLCQNLIDSMGCIWFSLDPQTATPAPHPAFHMYLHTPRFNVTVGGCLSQYLVQSEEEDAAFEAWNLTKREPLERLVHIDRLDPLVAKCLPYFDAVVFSTGQWWLGKPKVFMLMNEPVEVPMRTALDGALRTVTNHMLTVGYKGVPILRTVTPSHFFSGAWNTGGWCPQTVPLSLEERDLHEREDDRNWQIFASESSLLAKEPFFRVMDVFRLMNFRADSHPGIYNKPQNKRQEGEASDCVHWCMPGAVDVWTQFYYAMLLREPSFQRNQTVALPP